MNMFSRIGILVLLCLAIALPMGCGESGHDDHGDEAGHVEGDSHDEGADGHDDHGDESEHADGDNHDEDGGGHDDHGEDVVKLTRKQLDDAGVVIEPLTGGEIAVHVTLPAEVGLNEDTVLHVTPRVPGIVSEVLGFLGQEVGSNDLLAVIESPGLGEAKITYLQAIQAKEIAEAELVRRRTISENTATLLDLLRKTPEIDDLQASVSGLRIGENKGRLLSSYARARSARANYDRERELRSKGLSTEIDLLASQEAYNSAQAEYFAAFEDIDFTYQLRLQEAERTAGVTASTVENAERRLHLLGLTEQQVAAVSSEPDTNVARYELRAPVGGTLIFKHITPGEKVTGEDPVYTIADLRTVWLNISVYSEYVDKIQMGQEVTVHAGDRTTKGVVEYVSAVMSEDTRTVSARVVIQNKDGRWKPGEFVIANVQAERVSVTRVVPLSAIQKFEGADVVFVQDEDGIEPVPVRLGRQNDISVEILSDDIAIGTPIVVKNSFLMKAELGKSAAGHEH